MNIVHARHASFIAFTSLVMLFQIARDERPLPQIEQVGPRRVL